MKRYLRYCILPVIVVWITSTNIIAGQLCLSTSVRESRGRIKPLDRASCHQGCNASEDTCLQSVSASYDSSSNYAYSDNYTCLQQANSDLQMCKQNCSGYGCSQCQPNYSIATSECAQVLDIMLNAAAIAEQQANSGCVTGCRIAHLDALRSELNFSSNG